MKFVFAAAMALLATASLPNAVQAQSAVVDFDTNASIRPFTGTLIEDGYRVTYVAGNLAIEDNFSTVGDVIFQSGSFNLTRLGGGQFSFDQFVGGGFNNGPFGGGTVAFDVKGYLGASNTYSQTFNFNLGLDAFTSPTSTFVPTPTVNLFDRVNFTMSGARAAIPLVNSINVTGVAAPLPPAPPVSAVPEPTTWAMMILGFGLTGAAMRRPRTRTVRFA